MIRTRSYHYSIGEGDVVRIFWSDRFPTTFYGRPRVRIPSDAVGMLKCHVLKGKAHKYLIDFGEHGIVWCTRCHFTRCTRKLGTLRDKYCLACNYRFYCFTQR